MLTKESFNALLKTLEEPPPHVIFMFATTEIEKVPPTILSRCLQLNLRLVSEKEIEKQLSKIFDQEKITYDEESLKIISKAASGSMRDALTISEKVVSYCSENLNKQDVQNILGIPDEEIIFSILDILKDKDSISLVKFFEDFDENNSCKNILESLMYSIQEISLLQFGKSIDNKLNKYTEMTPEYLQLIYQIGLSNKVYFESTSDEKGLLAMTLIKMVAFSPEKKNFEIESFDLKTDSLLFDWDQVLKKLNVSNLLKQILFYASAKKNKDEIVISIPEDKFKRINENYKKEISNSLCAHFNEVLKISYDFQVDYENTPSQIKNAMEMKESDEAIDLISKDEGFKKITTELNADIKNVTKK